MTMAGIESAFYDISRLDSMAGQRSLIHDLDPRIKVVATMCFIITVVSVDRYAVSHLLPFFLFPLLILAGANLPAIYFARKLLILSPLVLFIAIFNPLLDRTVMVQIGPLAVSGGWISFCSIILRFVLTVSAALLLIATTGFTGICMALERLGMPRVFAVQLLFLYRYIFVLVDEGVRMSRARALRSFSGRGLGLGVFSSLVGSLLIRTLDRAQRIHMAMLCRGFRGDIRISRPLAIGRNEFFFLAGSVLFFLLARLVNISLLLGNFFIEAVR